jgi:hypothetical protein
MQDVINGTISAGEGVLNTLLTPMYFVEDAVWRTIHNATDPKVQKKVAKLQANDPVGYFSWLGKQVSDTAAASTAWTRGEVVKHTGGAIAKQLGLIQEAKNGKLNFGQQAGNVAAGLAFDILLDPTTYIPGGAIAKVLTATTKTAEYGIKGLAEGAKGMVPVERAVQKGVTPAVATAKELAAKEVSVKGARIKEANLVGAEAPANVKGTQRAYNVALQNTKTKLVQVPNAVDRLTTEKVSDAVATSLTMGYNALRGTLLSHNANAFLAKYAKDVAKAAKKGQGITKAAEQIAKDAAPVEEVAATEAATKAAAETVVPTPAQAAKGFAPVVDKPTVFEKTQASLAKSEYDFLRKTNADLEKIAKSAKGESMTGELVSKTLENVILKRRKIADDAFAAVPPEYQKIIRSEYKKIPFQILEQYQKKSEQGSKTALEAFAEKIMDRPVNLTTGRTTIRKIMGTGVNFHSLDIKDRLAINRQFELAFDGATATKLAEAELASIIKDPADLAAMLEKNAAGAGRFDVAGIKADIARIASKQGSEAKRYTSVDEMLAGLQAGDRISNTTLTKFIKTLDPDAPIIKDLASKAAKPGEVNLGQYLLANYPQTIAQMRKRLFLDSPEQRLKASGVSAADNVYAFFDAYSNGSAVFTPAITKETSQEAAKRVATLTPSRKQFIADIVSETLKQRFKQMDEILTNENSIYRETSLKDMAAIFDEEDLSKGAILPNAINQNAQAVLFHKTAGAARSLTGIRMAKMKPEKIANFSAAETLMDEVSRTMRDIDSMFKAVFKTNMFVQRYAEKGVKNLENKHVAFIHMGDIVDVFRATGGTEILQRALFPIGKDFTKYDALDGVSVLNAAERMLNYRAANETGDLMAELTAISRKKDSVEKLSKAYSNELDQIAADFAQHLNSVAPELEAIHLNRAKAVVTDITSDTMGVASEVMDLYKTGLAMIARDGFYDSPANFDALKDVFNRFSYVTGAMRQRSGDVAAGLSEATAMLFLRNGKFNTGKKTLLDEVFSLLPEAGTQAEKDYFAALNTFAAHEDPMLAPPPGREHILRPDIDKVKKAETKYAAAKQVMDDLRAEGTQLTSKTALAGWKKRVATAVKRMDAARQGAWEAWLPVEHWSNVENRWVPSDQFNHAAELEWAKMHPPVLVEGVATKIGNDLVDAAVKTQRKSTPTEKAAAKKAAEAAVKAHDVQMAEVVAQDTASALLEAEKLAEPVADDALAAAETMNEWYLRRIEASRMKVYSYPMDLKKADKGIQNVDRLSLMQRIGGRISIQSGMKDLAPVLQSLESSLRKVESDMAHSIDQMLSAYPEQVKNLDIFSEFYHRAINKLPLDETATETERAFQGYLNRLMTGVLDDAEKNGLNNQNLKKAFSHYKVSFNTEGNIKNVLDNLPINKNPFEKDTDEWLKFEQNRVSFLEDGGTAPNTLLRVISALQYEKMYKNMAGILVNDFGWKAAGYGSAEAARKAGFVEIRASGESQLMNAMVGPAEGALFHPEIATQIGALDRAQNKIFNSDRLPKIALTLMTLTSYIKFTQTSINPRHHITNMVGDTTAEIIAGTVNPAHWIYGQRVAAEFFKGLKMAEYGKAMLDNSLTRSLSNLGTPEEIRSGIENLTKHGADTIAPVINGKARVMTLAQFADILAKANILTGSMFNDEILALYEHLIVDSTSKASVRDLKKNVQNRARLGIEKGMKPFGDFAAAYSNISRAAGAVRIATERNWRTEQDMINAISKHVHTFHPTISSLAPAERRYGRLLIGYYTWLRGAHTALADMIVNHTAATLAMPKLLSNVRQTNQIEQTSPGTPWAPGAPVPQNMKGSVYGPLFMGANGPVGIQTSTLPLDVLNNWQMYYDPMLNADQMAGMNLQVLTRYLAGSSNPAARQIMQEMLGMDFQTGKTFTDRSAGAAIDRFIQTLGPSQLAQGLGVYTPQGKTVTPEQRQQKLRKYVFGTKEFNQNDPGIQKAANLESSARIKKFLANLPKENK